MPSKSRQWKLRIRHMLEGIRENGAFVRGMTYEQFGADERTVKAIVWNLTVIGEAARHIPPEIEAAHPQVPWAQIRGMRNHIVHGYDQIDLEIVWKVVQEELPALVPPLEGILHEPQQ